MKQRAKWFLEIVLEKIFIWYLENKTFLLDMDIFIVYWFD